MVVLEGFAALFDLVLLLYIKEGFYLDKAMIYMLLRDTPEVVRKEGVPCNK